MSKIAILGAAHPQVLHLAHLVVEIEGAKRVGLYDDDNQRRQESAGN